MRLDSYSEVKRLTSEMVAIPSINKEPSGESAVAQYVYDYFALHLRFCQRNKG